MPRHDVRWISGVIGIALVAACNKASPPADTVGVVKAAVKGSVSAVQAGLQGLPEDLDKLLADSAGFVNYVAGVEASTPPQDTLQAKVSVDKKTCGHGGKVTLNVQSFATAGVYSYDDLTIGNNSTGHGYLISRVGNDDDCMPVGIPIPAKGVGLVFVVLKSGGNQNLPTDYSVRIIDSTRRADIKTGFSLPFSACSASTGSAHWYGDHAQAKSWKDLCDHKPPKLLSPTKLVAPGDLDDTWSLWFSCGSNCCFADTGGSKGGPADSTRGDSTKKGMKKA